LPDCTTHSPLALQISAPLQLSGSGALVTVWHAPLPARHCWQTPALGHAAAQQTPTPQIPEAQLPGAVQLEPAGNVGTQAPPAQ
jgi:hypothetical protein